MRLRAPYHIRFFVRRTWIDTKGKTRFSNYTIHYRGEDVTDCIDKARRYCSDSTLITSYTILEGKGRGKNKKLNLTGYSKNETTMIHRVATGYYANQII